MFEDQFTCMLRAHPDALADRKRFVGLIRDYFPGQQMQLNLLITAYDTGIATEIQNSSQLNNSFGFRYVKRLVDDFGINRANADWAVAAWCVCYGQQVLGKPCDIKMSHGRSNSAPSIREERLEENKTYGDLFSYTKVSDGFGVNGFSGTDKQTIIFSNSYQRQPVVSVLPSAFMETNVSEAVFSEGILRLEATAFKGCTELKQAILPQSLKEIGNSTFEGCRKLTTVTVPMQLEQIGNYSFAGTALKEAILPKSLSWVGEGAFSNCNNLESVVIPANITTISKNMFRGCSKLQKVTLPSTLEAIEEGAFAECASLQHIEVPDSVKKIGLHAFDGCNEKFTLLCKRLSIGEEYARRNDITFQIIYF